MDKGSGNEDPFELLGVSETASDEAIHVAWRHRIRLCHPDNATDDADRELRLEKSVALNRARDVLLDPVSRADALLNRPLRNRRGTPLDAWDGARWSTGYRAGGHPEARETWSYTEPPVAAESVGVAAAPDSFFRRHRVLRIVATAVGIFGWAIKSVAGTIARGFFGQAAWPDPD